MDRYVTIGEMLIRKKQSCKAGEFVHWVNDNLDLKIRECQRYMRIARNKEKLQHCHGIGQAMEFLQ